MPPLSPSGAPRPTPPWTVRVVQAELCLLALLVALAPALTAVLLVSLALISLDGHSGVQTLAISAALAFGMVVVGSAACTGVLVLGRSLGRGSRRSRPPAPVAETRAPRTCYRDVTLTFAKLAAAARRCPVSRIALASRIAPAFALPVRVSALVAASPSALGALLLLSPTTLRSVSSAPRRGSARPITPERRPAAQA